MQTLLPKAVSISGAAGSGKSTLVDLLFKKYPEIGEITAKVVTDTSRDIRIGPDGRPLEVDGIHYNFKHPEIFKRGIARGDYIEYAMVHSTQGREYLYGSTWAELERIDSLGKTPLYVVEVQGVATLRSKLDLRRIAILPPNPWREILRTRMSRRGDKPHQIEERMASAEKEMAELVNYDFTMVNREGKEYLDQSCEELAYLVKKAVSSLQRKP